MIFTSGLAIDGAERKAHLLGGRKGSNMADEYDFSEDAAIVNGERVLTKSGGASGSVLVRCENVGKCGPTGEICSHGKPHAARRCGSCGTWCTGSNALCSGGQCSHPKYGGTFYPGKCVPVG